MLKPSRWTQAGAEANRSTSLHRREITAVCGNGGGRCSRDGIRTSPASRRNHLVAAAPIRNTAKPACSDIRHVAHAGSRIGRAASGTACSVMIIRKGNEFIGGRSRPVTNRGDGPAESGRYGLERPPRHAHAVATAVGSSWDRRPQALHRGFSGFWAQIAQKAAWCVVLPSFWYANADFCTSRTEPNLYFAAPSDPDAGAQRWRCPGNPCPKSAKSVMRCWPHPPPKCQLPEVRSHVSSQDGNALKQRQTPRESTWPSKRASHVAASS
jgi:hypothetical protein